MAYPTRFPVLCALAFALAPVLVAGCFSSTPEPVYPPAREIKQAPFQRREFVDAFLQGKWCEAEQRFAAAVQAYLQRDDVCQASYTYLLAWKLKRYVEIDAPELLENARKFQALGFGCPENPPVPLTDGPDEVGLSARDRRYREYIARQDYAGLLEALTKEEDPLYASVYARKAARQAIDAGRNPQARALVEYARTRDAAQGWVVFVREDWRILRRLASSANEQALIDERLAVLEDIIRPCTPKP